MDTPPYLILGVGNPGSEYAHTRHNLGFMVIDELATKHGLAVRRRQFHSLCGEGRISGQRVVLLKPLTFVNLTGKAAGAALRHFKAPIAQLLVVCDDLNLATGKLRIRTNGSAGGHHGLEDLIARLGSQEFPRLRIGIDRPNSERGGEVTGHVLSRFSNTEAALVAEAVERATEAIECWLAEGADCAMSRYN